MEDYFIARVFAPKRRPEYRQWREWAQEADMRVDYELRQRAVANPESAKWDNRIWVNPPTD